MNVLEAIKARRSVRSFDRLPVSLGGRVHLVGTRRFMHRTRSTLSRGRLRSSKTESGLQRFSDGAKRLALENAARDPKSAHYAMLLRSESLNVFHGAATLITISVHERSAYGDAAAWLAAQNLMLAACTIGLGTCCIGLALPYLNTAETKAELEIPNDSRVHRSGRRRTPQCFTTLATALCAIDFDLASRRRSSFDLTIDNRGGGQHSRVLPNPSLGKHRRIRAGASSAVTAISPDDTYRAQREIASGLRRKAITSR